MIIEDSTEVLTTGFLLPSKVKHLQTVRSSQTLNMNSLQIPGFYSACTSSVMSLKNKKMILE